MYLHDRFRICLLALESRYPFHRLMFNPSLPGLDLPIQRRQTSPELRAFLAQHASSLLEKMAILRIDEQTAAIYLPEYSIEEPVCTLSYRGRSLSQAKRVAVVGDGPTGLSAAFDLQRRGHHVELFESLPQAGGALGDAIPETRLSRTLVEHDIKALQQAGVDMHFRTAVGLDLPFSILQSEFDALLLAIGSQQSHHLDIPGETQLYGIFPARSFLHALNSGQKFSLGEHVIVIGGDRTAVYAARAARQEGAQTVIMLYEGTRKTITVPREELQAARQEGVVLYERIVPKNFIGTEEATLQALRCAEVTWSQSGTGAGRSLEYCHGHDIILPVDTVLVAAGEYPDLAPFSLTADTLISQKSTSTRRGMQKYAMYQTSIPGVFVAGGILFPQQTITQAIHYGRQVARLIDAYLHQISLEEVSNLPDDQLAIASAPVALQKSISLK